MAAARSLALATGRPASSSWLGGRGVVGLEPLGAPADGADGPVALEHRPHPQAQLPPPDQVGGVAEGAEHGDAGALARVGEPVAEQRHPGSEQGRAHRAADQLAEAVVVGVGDQGDAGRQQLGPGGVDLDGPVQLVDGEPDPVGHPLDPAVLQLGLGHRRVEVDLPQRRRLRLVG
jgi:hypothetical protein